MSIEFHCSRCQSVLRVPDEIAGRKAQCPYCEAIQIVPAQQSPGPGGGVPPQMEPQPIPSGTVPPQYPQHSGPASLPIPPDYRNVGFAPPFVPPETLVPTQVEFSDLFQKTWDSFFNRIADFLLLGLITCGILVAVGVLSSVVQSLSGFVIDPENIDANGGGPFAVFILFAGAILINLPSSLVQAYIFIGGIRYSLHLVRGGETRIALMFPSILPAVYYIGSYLVLFLIMFLPLLLAGGVLTTVWVVNQQANINNLEGILLVAGLILLLLYIPFAIYVSMRFFLTPCFIVDRGEGPIQAIQNSFAYTSKNGLTLIAVILAYSFISFVVVLCTCYTGAILAYPLGECLAAVAYLMLTGQWPGMTAPQPQQHYGLPETRL